MMQIRILTLVITLMLFASNCLATDWVDMGRVDGWLSRSEKEYQEDKQKIKWYFDADSVQVNDDNSVSAIVKHENYIINQTEYKLIKLVCGRGPADSAVKVLTQNIYDNKTGALLYDLKYPLTDGNYYTLTSELYGIYCEPILMYRELGYFNNMPNENGSPYITPKSMGLTWINSTDKVGVFYYPNTVKVKKNAVDVKVVFWFPLENRIQTIQCTLDYNKKLFKPKSCEMRRISTGDITELEYKGLIPGITGPRFINSKFDHDDEMRILSEYFKGKVS